MPAGWFRPSTKPLSIFDRESTPNYRYSAGAHGSFEREFLEAQNLTLDNGTAGTLTVTTLNVTTLDTSTLDVDTLTGLSGVQGDVLYHNGTSWVRLPAGTSGHFLKTQGAGANPLWDATAAAGAPTNADYLVGTANGSLSAEIVVGTSPGGELGGTWAAPTVDTNHATGWHPLAAYESGTHSVTDATLVNSDLVITPGLASTWSVDLWADLDGTTQGGWRHDFSGATSGRYEWRITADDGSVVAAGEVSTPGTDVTVTAATFGVVDTAHLNIRGAFTTSTDIQFRFAQETDAGTGVSILSFSNMFGVRVV